MRAGKECERRVRIIALGREVQPSCRLKPRKPVTLSYNAFYPSVSQGVLFGVFTPHLFPCIDHPNLRNLKVNCKESDLEPIHALVYRK